MDTAQATLCAMSRDSMVSEISDILTVSAKIENNLNQKGVNERRKR